MRADELRTLHTDRAITQRCAFSRAGHDTDVFHVRFRDSDSLLKKSFHGPLLIKMATSLAKDVTFAALLKSLIRQAVMTA